MKKILLSFLMLLPLVASAQVERTINVEEAGTLSSYISDDEKYQIEKLTLSGELNGTDIHFIRDMAGTNCDKIQRDGYIHALDAKTEGKLRVLDLSDARIVEGGREYFKYLISDEPVDVWDGFKYTTNDAISSDMFFGCYALEDLTLPHSATLISWDNNIICYKHNIKYLKVADGNPYYDSRDNCNAIIESNSNTLIFGSANSIIPNSVTSIGIGAFAGCGGLTSINIPNSVTTIGDYAFSICNGLTSVTIPNSVTSIGIGAFASCSGLTSLTIPNGVTTIGQGAFSRCSGLTSLTIPNSVTTIGWYAFQLCSGLTSVTIPNGVTTIGQGAFASCSGLTSVTIPNSVTSIGSGAFQECGLTSIISEIQDPFPIDNVFYCYSDGKDIYGTATLTVPEGTKLKYQSTEGWNEFQNIVESSGATERTIHVAEAGTLSDYISENEKYNIEKLTLTGEINGDDLGFIREMAGKKRRSEKRPFFDDTAGQLISLDISGANIVAGGLSMYIREIDDDFEYTVTRNNEIPPRLFEGCTKLAHISIPNSVNSIGSYAFNGTRWLNNQPDGVVYLGKVLYLYKGDMPANTSIAVKEGTIGIACSAFKDCSNLTSITIPNSVTNIGGFNWYPKVEYNDVFQGCNGLTTIISEIQNPFDLGSTFSYVDSSVFSNATLYVPKGTVSAYQSKEGWNKFQKIVEASGGSSSTDVVVENNVVYEIEGVTVAVVHADDVSGDVTIEASVEINGKTYEVTIIAEEAFKDCTQMTSAELPNSVTTIGEKAFDGCTSLRVIKIGRGVLEIARRAFANIFTSAGTRGEDDGLHFYCEAESVPNTSPEAFEGTDIAHATLHVPDNLVDTYKNSAPWSGFGTIVGLSETGILSIVVDISDIQIFDIQGNKLEKPRKGLNIIRTKDGKVKKVFVK